MKDGDPPARLQEAHPFGTRSSLVLKDAMVCRFTAPRET